MFMYLGVNFAISVDGNQLNQDYNFHFEGDLMDTYLSGAQDLDTLAQDTKDNWTNYAVGLGGNFTARPTKEGGQDVGAGGISFLDGLDIAWSFVLTLCNLMIAPLTLFFNFGMPVFIGLMIGVPYFLILVLTLFAFIRGAGD